jgi:AcrR family transcriptional regulator
MTDTLQAERPVSRADEDSAKRRQIVDGAREIFLAQGFDAASMNDIARAAGVSKGTLYVYFKDKEQLFEAIVTAECASHAEGVFDFDLPGEDVGATLTRVGTAFVNMMVQLPKVSAVRTVIAIADRAPETGRKFYETGPAVGLAKMKAYLDSQVKAGTLHIDDTEVAAAQFMESCHATLFKPVLFNFGPPPSPERIKHCVGIAVRTFLAAYAKK